MFYPCQKFSRSAYASLSALETMTLAGVWQKLVAFMRALRTAVFDSGHAGTARQQQKCPDNAIAQNFISRALIAPVAPTQKRTAALALGVRAEILAALWLMLKGYSLLNWRFCLKGGELDLILRRGNTIAFVEIKARRSHVAALEAVTPQKIRRLRYAARHWLMCNPWAKDFYLRGDIVTFAKGAWPRHISNAFVLWT